MARFATDSRYVLDTSGRTASRKAMGSAQYSAYVCTQGDTLERIAARQLGSEHRYWEIADLNPHVKFPLDIAVGTVLRLPL